MSDRASQPIRVLVVDDEEASFALLEALLDELGATAYALTWVSDWGAALAAMEQDDYDLYLVDHGLGARTGVELLEAAAAAGCTGPRVLMTGNRDPEVDRAAMRAGAVDFLLKETITGEGLERAMRYALERGRLTQALQDQAARVSGGIAHDFNNMLMGIVGNLELAGRAPGCPDEVREHLDRARSGADRAAELSRRLLAYARREHVSVGVVEVGAAIAEMAPSLRQRTEARGRFELEVAEGDFHVEAGRGELEELLLNLVANATDAIPDGGTVRVEVGPVRRPAAWEGGGEADYLRLTVLDDGRGMPAHVADRIFEPFFTTRRGRGGTGLGLAMVRDIVTRRGGRIELTTEPDRGTRFDLLLPTVAAPASAPATSAPERSVGGTLGLVLLVDDEVDIRRILGEALRRDGATVIEAASGEEALALLDRDGARPAVLMTDLTMPGMDGFELQARLRERCAGFRTLFMTGYGDEAFRDRGLDEATEAILHKPFRLAEMFAALSGLSRDD
jgi:two-component system, cell cycle sensor histidine kinase and response regulator CckA